MPTSTTARSGRLRRPALALATVAAATLASTPMLATAATRDGAITRAEVIARAQTWIDAGGVPYSQSSYYGGYRQDCSGYVSMSWYLGSSITTPIIPNYTVAIDKASLKAGDVLNNANAGDAGHVVIFESWADDAHTQYVGYEQAGPTGALTRHRVIPYPYFSHQSEYSPRRYVNIQDAGSTTPPVAVAGVSQTFGSLGQVLSFSAANSSAGSGSISSYTWRFTDGTTASGANVSVRLTRSGIFHGDLTVRNSNGATATDSVMVRVVGENTGQDRLGDMQGDGYSDIFQFTSDGSGTYVWTANSDGTYYARGRVATGTGKAWEDRLADYNGDGRSDIFQFASSGVYLWTADANGLGYTYRGLVATGTGVYWENALGDANHDGRADIYQFASDGSGVHLWTANPFGYGYTNKGVVITGNGASWQNRLGDSNGDGYTDVYQLTDGGGIWEWTANSDATYLARGRVATGNGWVYEDKLVDVTGDGRTDILQISPGAGTYLWTANASGIGYTYVGRVATGTGSAWEVKFGDANRDGRKDLYQFANESGTYLWLANASGAFTYAGRIATGTGMAYENQIGDANRDGYADFYQFAGDMSGTYLWLGGSPVTARGLVATGTGSAL